MNNKNKRSGFFSRITRLLLPIEQAQRVRDEQRRIRQDISRAAKMLDEKPGRLKEGDDLERMMLVWRISPDKVPLVIRDRRRHAIVFLVAGMFFFLAVPILTSGASRAIAMAAMIQTFLIGGLMLFSAGQSWWRAACLHTGNYQPFLKFWFGDFARLGKGDRRG